MLGRHVYRVTPGISGGWTVAKEGASQQDQSQLREAAVALACTLAAADEPSKVVIEDTDGTLAGERLFGIEPGIDPPI